MYKGPSTYLVLILRITISLHLNYITTCKGHLALNTTKFDRSPHIITGRHVLQNGFSITHQSSLKLSPGTDAGPDAGIMRWLQELHSSGREKHQNCTSVCPLFAQSFMETLNRHWWHWIVTSPRGESDMQHRPGGAQERTRHSVQRWTAEQSHHTGSPQDDQWLAASHSPQHCSLRHAGAPAGTWQTGSAAGTNFYKAVVIYS